MTAPDPRQTATDLRVAARCIETAGHAEGSEVEFLDGSLCLLGGIGIATSLYGIETYATGLGRNRFRVMPFHPEELVLTGGYKLAPPRAQACIDALARVIPDKVTFADKDLGDIRTLDLGSLTDPAARVYMYNDDVCQGGQDAQALLIEAAEKIEADL